MGILLAAVAALVAAAVLLGLAVARLGRLRSGVEEAWRHLDTALQERHDLVGELVTAVEPYRVPDDVTDRLVALCEAAALPGAPPPVQARAERELARSVDEVLVLVDAQPTAAADPTLRDVRHRLLAVDVRIVERHRTYELAAAELARALEGRLGRAVSTVSGVHAVEPYDPTEAPEPPDGRVQPEPI